MAGPSGILALIVLAATPLVPNDRQSISHATAPAGCFTNLARATQSDPAPAEREVSPAGFMVVEDAGLPLVQEVSQRGENPFRDEDAAPIPLPPRPIPLPPTSTPDNQMLPPDDQLFSPTEPPGGQPPPTEPPEAGLLDPGPLADAAAACDACGDACGCDTCGCDICGCGAWMDPVGWLWGVGYDAWIAQGLTINTFSPRNRSNFPVGFNDASNHYQMNQAYFLLERQVDEGGGWDIGGRVDLLYGTDAVFTSARGLELQRDLSPKWNSQRYGLAMPQCYMEVYAPWWDGLTVKLGHFYTTLGYESVPAVENFFYSHSYQMLYGEPFTHTGLLAAAPFGPWTVRAGFTRGWNNWEDNNNNLAFLGGVDWTSLDGRTMIAFDIHTGRERDEPPPDTNIRTSFSLVVQHQINDRWQYVGQYDHGFEGNGAPNRTRDADWYGLSQYLFYTINPEWEAGVRFEWFSDEDATRVDTTAARDYYELSFGLRWTPNDRVIVRPEFRWDWADSAGPPPFGDGLRHHQLLLDFDVIVSF